MSTVQLRAGDVPGGHLRVPVYVWELPVRIAHWLIFLSIAILSVTGIYMGRPFLVVPGEARFHFVMGTIKAIHFWAAFVFLAAIVMRVVWMFTGNRFAGWDRFIPLRHQRWRGVLPTLKYYLFMRREPPQHVGHNPLAGLTYTVVYGLFFFQALSGLALYGMSSHVGSPLRMFAALLPALGGAQTARYLHHIVMWLLWGFAAHHVWSAILVAVEERNGLVDSIFSGTKFIDAELEEMPSGALQRRVPSKSGS